ncbi:MAG: GldG family protein [Proteobacteria bacterium]|nr:GldG family protein [Pseudomonadota bacterium]
MSARRFALFAALAFLLMFVAANVIGNSWLRTWRLDLTQNHLYSLSPGTQTTLDHLSDSMELTLYYSRDAAARAPQVQAYAGRVREMLQTFAAHSHGQVRFTEVNVRPFTEEEDAAQQAGIQPVRADENSDPIYFGLTGANAIDDKRTIPFFDPAREPFLEYEVTRLIFELEHPDRTRVALITSLPIDPATAANAQGAATGQSAFATEMGRLFDVQKLPQNFTAIPEADVLVVIQPWALSPAQLYAVDQFILRKGRAFIALDPASMVAAQASASFNPMSAPTQGAVTSSLEPLLSRWGVAMSSDVVMDLEGALPVQAQGPNGQTTQVPQPLFFAVPAAQLDREDLMTAALTRGINFGLSGSLNISPRDGLQSHPLARTSGRTMHMPIQQALMRPSPYEILRDWQPDGRVETIAARLSGTLQTAYPSGPPEGGDALAAPRLARSVRPAELVVVADTDFLADDFYVDPQSGAAAADNASFALNAIDVLGGSDALVSLRSRAPSIRRMTLIDNMEREAQRLIQQRQEQLQGELEDTQQRLAHLQARGRGSGFFSGNLGAELTPEENAEIERFRAQVVDVRSQLRGVERDLRSGVNSLEAWIVFVNVWLMPILVAGIGLVLFWRRQRRAQGARR